MLQELQGAVRSRRRRRKAARGFAALGIVALLAGPWWWLTQTTEPVSPPRGVEGAYRSFAFERCGDDPDILARWTQPAPSRVEWVDDDGCNAMLLEAGYPSGIIRFGGEVRVLASIESFRVRE